MFATKNWKGNQNTSYNPVIVKNIDIKFGTSKLEVN